MKKFSVKKLIATAGAIGLTLGCVGCGLASPDSNMSGASSTSGNSSNVSGNSANSSGNSSNASADTDPDTQALRELNIETMTITFYDGYNYSTAEAINSFGEISLPEYVITLDAEQIKKVQDTLSETYRVGDDYFIALLDEFKICINGDIYMSCDNYRYLWYDESFETYGNEAFINAICEIADDYMQNQVAVKPFEAGIDFIIHDGDSVEVTDAIAEKLGEYSFGKVDISTDYEEYGEITYTILLNDGNNLLLYKDSSKYGYLDGKDYGFYVLIGNVENRSLIEYLDIVHHNQQNGLGAAEDDSPVTVTYDAQSHIVDEKLAECIKAETRNMEYSQFNWLDRNYDIEESIELSIDDGFYYIPVSRNYLNRYYKSKDGEMYLIGCFSTEVENSLFEMCGVQR